MATKSNVSGLFNIDKPRGITSHDVVARVRRIVGQRKVGHAGTLDPLATGVLLVCLGQATRLIEYLVTGQKKYRATIRFGQTTNTDDAEGAIIHQTDTSHLTLTAIEAVLPRFVGDIQQTPPIFSAIKQGGQPVYKRARAGEVVDLPPRPIRIDSLAWQAWQPPDLTLDVTCSPGTYIRSLARDVGVAVGTGAHLVDLVRTASGRFNVAEAVSLAEIEADWAVHRQPMEAAVTHLPYLKLTDADITHLQNGRKIRLNPADTPVNQADEPLCGYTAKGQLLAILQQDDADKHLWKPKKVFHPQEAV